MALQWYASAAAHAHGHRKPGDLHCSWPLKIVSERRDLDFTQCFEMAVMLPAPLVLAIVVGLAQIFTVTRKLRRTGRDSLDWIERTPRNERAARAKVVRSVVVLRGLY